MLIYWAESKYKSKRERRIMGCDHLPVVRAFAIPTEEDYPGFDLADIPIRVYELRSGARDPRDPHPRL